MPSARHMPIIAPTTTGGALVSISLAATIGAAWLAIHVGGIFFWSWKPELIPAAIVLVALQAWLSTGLFIVAHDCMHGSFAPRRPRINKAVGTVSLAAYAALSYRALLPKHMEHHAAPGTETDPDFHPSEPRRPVAWFMGFFRSYYTHGQIARITGAAIVYMLLGASLLNIVIFWAVPAVVALVQLFMFGTYLPHRHTDQEFADGHRARSNARSHMGSLLTCYHFGGYHHEHHLSPATPWWRLPNVR